MKGRIAAGLLTIAMAAAMISPLTAKAEDNWVSAESLGGTTDASSIDISNYDSFSDYSVSVSGTSSDLLTMNSSSDAKPVSDFSWGTATVNDLVGLYGPAGSFNGQQAIWQIVGVDLSTIRADYPAVAATLGKDTKLSSIVTGK